MRGQSYMDIMHNRTRPAAQHLAYQPFWPQYTLPPIARLMPPAQGTPPLIAGTNMPNMGIGQFGQLPGLPGLPITSDIAKGYVDAVWPHLQPHVREEAIAAAEQATVRAAFMAGGVALVVLAAAYWAKKM